MKLSRRGIGMKGLGLALALGVGLVGCAVLTVDVDVYKGALVNEEHVQLHQLTALATAAKPMLIGLRNALEWPYSGGMPPEGSCPSGEQYWYEQGWVDEWLGLMQNSPSATKPNATPLKQGATCLKGFKKPLARRVNTILHLYEDLGTKELSYSAQKLLDTEVRIETAQSRFEGNPQQDQEKYAYIQEQFKPTSELDGKLRDLKMAYEIILCSGSSKEPESLCRKVGALMDALQTVQTADSKDAKKQWITVEDKLIATWEKSEAYKTKDNLYERRLPFRAVWKLLSEADEHSALAKATKQLFRDPDQGRGREAYKALTGWVREIADAYWGSREATHELWEASLGVLIQLDRLEQKEPRRHRALLEQAIEVVVQLTNVRHVASALERVKIDGRCLLLDHALTSGLTCNSESSENQAIWEESKVRADPKRYEMLLRRALSQTPTDTAYFLLHLDQLEQGAAPRTEAKAKTLVELVNKGSTQHIVRLGLNRSYPDGDEQDNYNRLVRALSRGLAGGFERGRLLSGIHTLTEKYLDAHDRATASSTSRKIKSIDEDEHNRRLLDALVEFAEKVRFLANHESLASPPVASGLIFGGAENLSRGLLGDHFADRHISPWIGKEELDESKKQRYVRVLQAVGNSILFSANELREKERHREEGQKKVVAEVTAARSVYSPDPEKVLSDLLTELEHDKKSAETALDDANARKKDIEKNIGSAATSPPTGLHAKKVAAEQELQRAEQDLNTYRNSLVMLEAIHSILSVEVIKQVKSQWSAGQPDPTDVSGFLKGTDGFSLKDKLDVLRQSQNGTLTPEENLRWTNALQHIDASKTGKDFEAYRVLQGQSSLKRADLFDGFVAHIKELEARRVKQIAQYERIHSEKQAALDSIAQQITTLNSELAHLVKRIGELPIGKANLETAKTEIESVKAAVLDEFDGERLFVYPKEVYGRVHLHLSKKSTPAAKMTQDILSSRVPPPGMPPLDPKGYQDPTEVMDAVIALLRHQQMEMVARFGKDSDEEKRATEALENAYRHRAGMIYIRPSSAYLRTSFPSTSLQDDPNLAWDNMLLKQGLRNLPFSSELRDILNPSVKQDQVLTSELDKQYWQNINRVRVSGAGATNQALVKDDVGNWYVKQYFGKTDQIWESAKNLALFSMSAKVPIDLAKQLNKASTPEGYAENSKETPTLQKVLEKHQGAYKTNTDEVKAKLERLHDKELKETLIAAWDAHKDLKDDASFNAELKQALEAEIVVWKAVATTLKEKADQDPGQAIVKDVGALSRLGKMLSAHITKISSPISSSDITQEEKELLEKQKKLADEQDKEKKKQEEANLEVEKKELEAKKKAELEKKRKMAVFDVHKVVGGQVTDILTDRNRVLDQYEQAIVFIGDAANPKETKQSN